jgi:hypothetical protein
LHRYITAVFGELGVRYIEERVTDDGYFSMDIYLPEHDVAVEFDGDSHYHDMDSLSISRGDSTTRTVGTELRDFFLAKRWGSAR